MPLLPQLPSWMTPWSAAEGRGSPSPWPRTASTARPSGWGKPKWRWTFLSCCETASTRQQKPVSTLPCSWSFPSSSLHWLAGGVWHTVLAAEDNCVIVKVGTQGKKHLSAPLSALERSTRASMKVYLCKAPRPALAARAQSGLVQGFGTVWMRAQHPLGRCVGPLAAHCAVFSTSQAFTRAGPAWVHPPRGHSGT